MLSVWLVLAEVKFSAEKAAVFNEKGVFSELKSKTESLRVAEILFWKDRFSTETEEDAPRKFFWVGAKGVPVQGELEPSAQVITKNLYDKSRTLSYTF